MGEYDDLEDMESKEKEAGEDMARGFESLVRKKKNRKSKSSPFTAPWRFFYM